MKAAKQKSCSVNEMEKMLESDDDLPSKYLLIYLNNLGVLEYKTMYVDTVSNRLLILMLLLL